MGTVREIAGVFLCIGFAFVLVIVVPAGLSSIASWWRFRKVRKQRRV